MRYHSCRLLADHFHLLVDIAEIHNNIQALLIVRVQGYLAAVDLEPRAAHIQRVVPGGDPGERVSAGRVSDGGLFRARVEIGRQYGSAWNHCAAGVVYHT